MPTCQAVIRNIVYKFMNRLEKSENSIIQGLVRIENREHTGTRYCMFILRMVSHIVSLLFITVFIVIFFPQVIFSHCNCRWSSLSCQELVFISHLIQLLLFLSGTDGIPPNLVCDIPDVLWLFLVGWVLLMI